MDVKTILTFSIISALFLCGCVKIEDTSDDAKYLQNVDIYLHRSSWWGEPIQSPNETENSTIQIEKYWAGKKNEAVAAYNTIVPLKVSPKYENSKNAFLQTMKEIEAISDYLSSPLSQWEDGVNPSQEQIDAKIDATRHFENVTKNGQKIMDSNVCSVKCNKYDNLTIICNEIDRLREGK